jgi:hypothetical protein
MEGVIMVGVTEINGIGLGAIIGLVEIVVIVIVIGISELKHRAK